MKRVLRDVVVGAVSAVATVGAGTGALMALATDALAQDAAPPAAPPSAPAPAPTPAVRHAPGAIHAVPPTNARTAPATATVTAPSAINALVPAPTVATALTAPTTTSRNTRFIKPSTLRRSPAPRI